MIAYTDSGHGNPLVFIHGFCETKALWADFEKELSKSNRIICVDLPGFGESQRLLEEPASIEFLADRVLDLLRELNLSKVALIGHSLGGYVALAMIEKQPEVCTGLCMFHSTAFADTPEKQENRDKTLDFIQRQGVETFLIAFIPSLFFPENRNYLQMEIEDLKTMALQTPLATVNAITLAMRNRKDRISVLENITAPVLYIVGKNDLAVPFELSEKQMTLAPNSTALVLEQTGHMGMLEKKKETLEAIHNFAQNCYE